MNSLGMCNKLKFIVRDVRVFDASRGRSAVARFIGLDVVL